MEKIDLSRFKEAHQKMYETALAEIKSGRKESHWMWYIFPQIYGLGRSSKSHYYAIRSLDEAIAFQRDPYLGRNLQEICRALLALESRNATEVFGRTDDKKLRSSMTLFSLAAGEDSVYQQVLNKFFDGEPDRRTFRILGR